MLSEFYRVGGFVRDTILGLTPKDVDYVVIGESPESMIRKGFVQVGGNFPVFLHPITKDEYALARSEISNGDGHKDFLYEWKGVSLIQDLNRRDLTINAMAMTHNGEVIDPYGGQIDLENGVLRHVSPAFLEDPLRVLRVARFAARYSFAVAPETMELMTQVAQKGMLNTLTAERVWMETEKALLCKSPNLYFEVLDECGALEIIFPEIHAMKGVPQAAKHHAEGDVFIHVMMVIKRAAELSKGLPDTSRLRIVAGALLHDLGKTKTPYELLWDAEGNPLGKHHGHEDPERFGGLLDGLAERLRMPKYVRNFAYTCALVHQNAHRAMDMAEGLARMYEDLGLERQSRHDPAYLDDFLTMCQADAEGRLRTLDNGTVERPLGYKQADYIREAMAAVAAVDAGVIIQGALKEGCSIDESKGRVVTARNRVGREFKRAKKAEREHAKSLESDAGMTP